jgi:hypothetical protein
MKHIPLPQPGIAALLLLMGAGPGLADPAQPAADHTPKSEFHLPPSADQGRDPFFPGSLRLWAGPLKDSRPAAAPMNLVLNGLSGSATHRFAMINGRTLAEGEESELSTSGSRIRVRCLKIEADSVTVLADGERRVLKFQHP